MTTDEIDMAVASIADLLKVGSMFYPPLAGVAPVISVFINFEASKLKIGIANGTIVPDGKGGLVPAHGQSEYDPRTGIFTGRKT